MELYNYLTKKKKKTNWKMKTRDWTRNYLWAVSLNFSSSRNCKIRKIRSLLSVDAIGNFLFLTQKPAYEPLSLTTITILMNNDKKKQLNQQANKQKLLFCVIYFSFKRKQNPRKRKSLSLPEKTHNFRTLCNLQFSEKLNFIETCSTQKFI